MQDDLINLHKPATTPKFFSVQTGSNGRSISPGKSKNRVVEPPGDAFEFVDDSDGSNHDDAVNQRTSKDNTVKKKLKKSPSKSKLTKSASVKKKKKTSSKQLDADDANRSFGFGDFDDGSLTKSPTTPDDSLESFTNQAATFSDSFTNNMNSSMNSTTLNGKVVIRKGKKKKSGSGTGEEKEKSPRSSSVSRKLMTMQPLTKQKSGRISPSAPSSPSGKVKTSSSLTKQKSSSKIKVSSKQSLGSSSADMDWFTPDPAQASVTSSNTSNTSPTRASNGTSKTKKSSSTSSPTRTSTRKLQSRRSSMVEKVGSPNTGLEVAKAETKKSRRRSYAGGKEEKVETSATPKTKTRHKVKTSSSGAAGRGQLANEIVKSKEKQRVIPRELFTILDIEPWSSENTKYSDLELMDTVESDPESVKKKYRFEFFGVVIYPFSMMCAIGSSLNAIQMCHLVFPEALNEKDPWVGSPLHYACGYEGKIDVVEWLIEQDNSMTTTLNRLKRSPFHIACQFNPRANILEALLRACPTGLQFPDKYGCTPLHLACENNAPIEVLELMTDNYSAACLVASQAGATPLHLALENRVHLPKIKVLVKGHEQQVLSIRDVEGRTPLHIAIENECDAKLVKFLVKCCPESLDCKTEWLGETPLEMAKRLDVDDDIIAILKEEASKH